jgi:hypothetical protein
MLRFSGVSTRSLRILVAAVAIGTPLVFVSTASADRESRYRESHRSSIGTLQIDGTNFTISKHRSANRQIIAALRQCGYDAWEKHGEVYVNTRYGRVPRIQWYGGTYDLQRSWRGDLLVLDLRRVGHRSSYSRSNVKRYPHGDQTGGIYTTIRRTDVITGRRPHPYDPDWDRRLSPTRGGRYDHGWNRRRDHNRDPGFNIHLNLKSRRH